MFKLLVALTLLVSSFALPAYATKPMPPRKSSVASDMKIIASTYEQLGKQIDDKAKNAASTKMVDTLIEKSANAKKQTPPSMAQMPEDQRAKVMEKYKTDMQIMIEHLKSMKTALQANNNAQARTHFEALKPWTTPDHDKQYQ